METLFLKNIKMQRSDKFLLLAVFCLLKNCLNVDACPDTDGTCVCDASYRSVICSRITSLQYRLPVGIPSNTRLLSINKSTLKKIGPTAFKATRGLTSIDLSSNRIETISEISFQNLPSLLTLSLQNNRIKLIPRATFAHSSSLTTLDLSGNRILVLIPFNFQGLANLEELILLRNPTMCVAMDAFSGLSKLRKLEMSEMNSTLESHLFNGLTNLKVLVIKRFQHVKSIPEDLFQSISGLENLNLEHLPLTADLSRATFAPLTKLKVLSLRACRLKKVPLEVLNVLQGSLTALDISQNPLDRITQHDFKHLRHLKLLILRNTGLAEIPPNALALPKLEELDLSGNNLRVLQSSAFGSNHKQLKNVTLGNNPWICDCRLRWLAEEKFLPYQSIPVVCAEPAGMLGLDIRHASRPLPKGYFQCEKPSISRFGIDPGKMSALMKESVSGSSLSFDVICIANGYPSPVVTWILPPMSREGHRKRRSVIDNEESYSWMLSDWITNVIESPKRRHKRDEERAYDTCTICDVPSKHSKKSIWVSKDAVLHVRDWVASSKIDVFTCQATNKNGTVRRSMAVVKDLGSADTTSTSAVPTGFMSRQQRNLTEHLPKDLYRYLDEDSSENIPAQSFYYYYNQWQSPESTRQYSNRRGVKSEQRKYPFEAGYLSNFPPPPHWLDQSREYSNRPAQPLMSKARDQNGNQEMKPCSPMRCKMNVEHTLPQRSGETDAFYYRANDLSSQPREGNLADWLTRESHTECCDRNKAVKTDSSKLLVIFIPICFLFANLQLIF